MGVGASALAKDDLALDTNLALGYDVPTMKVRDIIKALEADGWQQVRQVGSHRQFKHAAKTGTVTVPGKPGDDLQGWILNSIWKQAGLK